MKIYADVDIEHCQRLRNISCCLKEHFGAVQDATDNLSWRNKNEEEIIADIKLFYKLADLSQPSLRNSYNNPESKEQLYDSNHVGEHVDR